MNAGFFVCAISSLLFFIFAFVFTVLKGKAAIFISGFNTIPRQERQFYDTEKMSKEQRNMFVVWGFILGIGAIMCYFITEYIAVAVFVVWLIVVMKNVHLDEKRHLEKTGRTQFYENSGSRR